MPALKIASVLFALLLCPVVAQAAPTRFTDTVSGKGPDVILIPGLASSTEVFAATAHRLSATHRVHLIQVAGFAGAPAGGNADGLVVAPLVEELASYIAAQKIKAPAVIGHSVGGETALMLAERHPESVGRVMAVDALPFFPLTMNPQATVESIRPQADVMRDRLLGATDAQWTAMETAGMARFIKTESERAGPIKAAVASDRTVVARTAHELMTTDLRAALPSIKAPVTVVYAWDPIYGVPGEAIDATFAAAYAGTPSLVLTRIDDSFHFVMLDQPKAFAEAIDKFLR